MSYFITIDSTAPETFMIDLKLNSFIQWDGAELSRPLIQERMETGRIFFRIDKVQIHSHFFTFPPTPDRLNIQQLPRFEMTDLYISGVIHSIDEILLSHSACY